ncbi:MAG: hypothetical protein ACLFVO_02030 [Chloroflexaceae bacterium]
MDTLTFAVILVGALVVVGMLFVFRHRIKATVNREGFSISGTNPEKPTDGARISGSESRSGGAQATDTTGAGASIDTTRIERDLVASSSPAPTAATPPGAQIPDVSNATVEGSTAGNNTLATSGPGAVGVGGDANAPITTGSGNRVTSTGDIRDNRGQVAVGSNIAQADDKSSAHVDSSRSVFDQRGQRVGGSQYNSARDMNIGREQQEPRRQLSDRRLVQAVQTALEQHDLDELLFNLGSHTNLAVDTNTLGTDAATQARNLVTLCRSKNQRAALVAGLRDFEDGLLGTSAEEEDAWLAWAQERDNQ